MNQTVIDNLIQAATESVNQFGNGQNHTVGAAVLAKDGTIITAVNIFHFTGGPCGEIVAIGNAISQDHADLVAIVAVGDKNRGVIPPCGRCRQILFDYYPSMQVILSRDETYMARPISELLPNLYDWNNQQLSDTIEQTNHDPLLS